MSDIIKQKNTDAIGEYVVNVKDKWLGIVHNVDTGVVTVRITAAINRDFINSEVSVSSDDKDVVGLKLVLQLMQTTVDLLRIGMPGSFNGLQVGDLVVAGELCVGGVTERTGQDAIKSSSAEGVIISSLLRATKFYASEESILFMPKQKIFPEGKEDGEWEGE